jgi:hypothetical protein
MNAVMERWVQTCRHELLDRTLIWNERHLHYALCQFELHYNTHRPHQAIDQAAPCTPSPNPSPAHRSPSCRYAGKTASAESSTSINMLHELHGWGFRQAQPCTANSSIGP